MGDPKFLPNDNGEFEIKEIEGKTAFIFDSLPALLFVSGDGTSRTDRFFVQGTEIHGAKSIEILCDPGEDLTTYKLEHYACFRKENENA